MVRQMIFERFPDEVYTKGFRVYTTILKEDQEAAYLSLRKALLDPHERKKAGRKKEAA
jgi:penicillin-binding protein 1A